MFPKSRPRYISKSTMLIVGGGLLGYGGMEMLWSSETFQARALMPLINHYLDEEYSHDLAIRTASWGLFPRFGTNRKEYPELNCEFLGKSLRNPVGLASGFDKNGEAIRPLAELSGFGMIEIGSVTPIPQKGNPRPRIFRLQEDEGIINRYGFNNDGVGKVQQRVKAARSEWMDDFAMFGVNLGSNMLTDDAKIDYEIGINYFAGHSDYIVLNISGSNSFGLRSLLKKCELHKLLIYVKHTIDVMALDPRPKLLLKIPPNLTEDEKRNIAKIIMDPKHGVDALIVSGATTDRPHTLKNVHKVEAGELSGAPLRRASTECVREMYRFTKGQVPIVGCGGISSGADAYEKIRAGASVVQLHSALVFHGFPVVGKVKRELVDLLKKDGYVNVSQAVGADHRI